MPSNCSVPQCTSYYKKNKNLKYHKFPECSELRKKWLISIRSDKKPSKFAKVCSKHFNDCDYFTTSMGQWKILKSGSIPSQNLPLRKFEKPKDVSQRTQRFLKKETQICKGKCLNIAFTGKVPVIPSTSTMPDSHASTDSEETPEPSCTTTSEIHSSQRTVAIQTTVSFKRSQLISTNFLSEKQLKHFTGFYKKEFYLICDFFKTNSHYDCALSMEDEILLTLMKYRHNNYYRTLQSMFDVDIRVVKRIFNFWTDHIYVKLKSVDFWNLRHKRSNLEYDVIIDCTEMAIEKSQDPIIQQATFSSYKNTNTFKVLVGCTEYGAVVYVSDIFGGSTPDRVITEKSGFLNILEKGQFILADRGFDISDLLEVQQVHLNIPPFKINKQLSEEDVAKTRAIANRRILIEQINGLAKKNSILVHKMPSHIWPLANQIVYNCFMLTAFRNSIVK